MDWGILSMIVLDLEPFSFVNRFEVPLLTFLHLSYCRPGFLMFSCIANEKYNVRCPMYYTGLLDKVFIQCCPDPWVLVCRLTTRDLGWCRTSFVRTTQPTLVYKWMGGLLTTLDTWELSSVKLSIFLLLVKRKHFSYCIPCVWKLEILLATDYFSTTYIEFMFIGVS